MSERPPEVDAFREAAKALFEAFIREGLSPENASVKLRAAIDIAGDFQAVQAGGIMHYGRPCDGDNCQACSQMVKASARG